MTKKLYVLAAFSLAIAASMTLIGCGGGKTSNTTTDSTKTVIDTITEVKADAGIKSVKLYFDNSGSMAGYVNKNALDQSKTIINMVNALANDFGNGTLNFSANLCCVEKNKKAPQTGINFETFISMIQKGEIATGSESMLNKIVSSISDDVKNNPNQLSVFLTDGILSGPAEEIRKNPKYTPIHIVLLKSDLRNALIGKGLAASIYRFDNAGFVGEYYFYDNTHKSNHALKFNTRPIYAVVLGSPENVSQFKNWTEGKEAENFKPQKAVHAIKPMPINEGLTNATYGVKNGTVNFKYADVMAKNDGIIKMTLPKSVFKDMFPASEDLSKLADNIKVTIDGVERSGMVETSQEAFYINVPVTEIGKTKAKKLVVTIPYSIPGWVAENTTIDDKQNLTAGNTYMLNKFVEAIVEGISGGKGNIDKLFEQEVTLQSK